MREIRTSGRPGRWALPSRSISLLGHADEVIRLPSSYRNFAAIAHVWNWHHPEIPESTNYFRLLVHCGPRANLPAMLRARPWVVGTECELAEAAHGDQEFAADLK